MKITVEEKEITGRLVAWEGTIKLGEIAYSLANQSRLLIVDQTTVEKGQENKGVGKVLFYELVKMLREQQKEVISLCPFVQSMFARRKDIQDA